MVVSLLNSIKSCFHYRSSKKIGLTVQESNILLPQKSMIGLIGLGDNRKEKTCQNCLTYKKIVILEREVKQCYAKRLNKDLLIFDGGFGSQLQELGMKAGEIPEYYNIEHPKIIIDIHHRYLKAGADFITTNTFGANPLKLEQHKYSYQEVILAAIQNAKEAKKIN